MLATATTVDLGNSVANGIALLAVIISVIALFTADSRAKDANKIALDANKTSREARDIAREANNISRDSLTVSERADLREMYLKLEEPLADVTQRLYELARPEYGLDFDACLRHCTSIQNQLMKMVAITGRDSLLGRYIEAVYELMWTMRQSYHTMDDVNQEVLSNGTAEQLGAMGEAHRAITSAATLTRICLSTTLMTTPNDPVWERRLDSRNNLRGRMEDRVLSLYSLVKNIPRDDAANYLFF